MTNEEKAREICGGNYVVFNKEYAAALNMAEWKDKQNAWYLLDVDNEEGVYSSINENKGVIFAELIDEEFKYLTITRRSPFLQVGDESSLTNI